MSFAQGAPAAVALLGLMLGMRHATDPDHVIAVTTILSRERRLSTAARIGIFWGLGHTATLLAVGGAIILFRVAIPPRVGLAMEFAVAIVLILLGIPSVGALLRRIGRTLGQNRAHSPAGSGDAIIPLSDGDPESTGAVLVHSHPHLHHGSLHQHPHTHAASSAHRPAEIADHNHLLPSGLLGRFATGWPLLRAFGVGLVHGLAGSAAIALLVLGVIPRPLWASLYLAVFCCGTIVGMGLITTAIGAPFALASARMARLHNGLVIGSGLLSFAFGLVIAWQIGIGDHLFGAVPHWTPQ